MNPSVPKIKTSPKGIVTPNEIDEVMPALSASDKAVIGLKARIAKLREKQGKLRDHFPAARKAMRIKLLKREKEAYKRRIKAIPKQCNRHIKSLNKTVNKKSQSINRRVGIQLTLIARREKELRRKAALQIKERKEAAQKAELKAQRSSDKKRLISGPNTRDEPQGQKL